MKLNLKTNSVFCLLIFINSILLVLFKYVINSRSIAFSAIFYTGNLLNLLPFLICALTTLFLDKNNKELKISKFKKALLIANPFLIIFAFYFNKQDKLKTILFAGHYLNREIILIILLINYFIALWLVYDYLTANYFRVKNNKRATKLTILTFFLIYLLSLGLNVATQVLLNNKRLNGKQYLGIVLGAAVWHKNKVSPILKGRLETAIRLFNKHRLKLLQVTGGNSKGEISEALAAKRFLIKRGIPSDKILIEENTRSTSEQIIFIKKNLTEKFSRLKPLVISDAFHLARVFQMAKFFGLKLNGISSEYELNWQELIYYSLRDAMGITIFWLFTI